MDSTLGHRRQIGELLLERDGLLKIGGDDRRRTAAIWVALVLSAASWSRA